MSKIRANTQIIANTISRNLMDSAMTAELDKFGADIVGLSESKADLSYVNSQINELIGGAPEAMDTLNELAAALADDENFAATMTTQLTGLGNRLTAVEEDTSILKEADLVRGEVPSGEVDGTNAVFTMAREPRVGSVMLFKNGVADFSPDIEVDEAAKTVTFVVPPSNGDKIHVCYEAVRSA